MASESISSRAVVSWPIEDSASWDRHFSADQLALGGYPVIHVRQRCRELPTVRLVPVHPLARDRWIPMPAGEQARLGAALLEWTLNRARWELAWRKTDPMHRGERVAVLATIGEACPCDDVRRLVVEFVEMGGEGPKLAIELRQGSARDPGLVRLREACRRLGVSLGLEVGSSPSEVLAEVEPDYLVVSPTEHWENLLSVARKRARVILEGSPAEMHRGIDGWIEVHRLRAWECIACRFLFA